MDAYFPPNKLVLRFKKLNDNAVLPAYAKPGDAGLDLVCTSFLDTETYTEYGTGIAIEIPEGYMGLIFPRSSVSKSGQWLCNSIGLIDSSYRGELKLRYYSFETFERFKPGDRVGQLVIVPYPMVELMEVKELSETDRGQGGFGSSGK